MDERHALAWTVAPNTCPPAIQEGIELHALPCSCQAPASSAAFQGAHHHLNPLNLTRTITLSIHSLTCPTTATHSLITTSTPIHRPMGCGLVVLASGSLHMPSAAAAPSAGVLLLVWPSVLLSLLLALHLALHLVLALVRLVLATLRRCTC